MIEPPESDAGQDVSSTPTPSLKLAVEIHRIKLLLIRYWWIGALTITSGMVIQGYRCSQLSPQYISSSRMMVSGQINFNQGPGYSEELINFFGTQAVLMKSPETLADAMARVHAIHPEVAVDTNARVDASQELKTSIFDLHVTSTNPEYAPLLLNAVMDSYLASKQNRREHTTDTAVSAITAEIHELDRDMKDDEQKLLDFQAKNSVVSIEEQSNSAAAYLVGLINELARLTKEHDLLVLESNNSPAPGTGSNDTGPTASDPSVQAEQETIEKLKILRDDYSTYLKDQHPKMIALSDAINKEQKFLDSLKTKSVKEREAHRQDLELQIQNLEKQIADWNKKSLDLNQAMATFQILKGKITREQAMYAQLSQNVSSVHLNNSLDQQDVAVMEQATPASLIPIDYQRQMTYGGILGAVAGVVLLHLISRLDDKVSSPMMIDGMFSFPIIGQIPLAKSKGKRVPLIEINDKRHILVESYRNIRSSILFRSNIKIQPKTLLVCGSTPGEGKSSLAANLGITFAFAGARTLLIDADLRRGIVHELFETSCNIGLSDYLRQKVSWREVVQATKYPGLEVIPRGRVPHHAGELLLGMLVDLLLQESAAEYDMVLWDSAPLLAADDTANLCSRVDGVLFIVRVSHSSIHSMTSAVDILAQRNAKIFGLVVNAVGRNQPGRYDRYRYKKYYEVEAQV